MTTDLRYIISVSNQFITYDVSTSDLVRCVHPKVRGLMMGIVISEDNRFAAAYTNYDQTILLNAITSEFTIIDNPLDDLQTVQGLLLHDNKLIIYGQYNWCIFSTVGKLVDTVDLEDKEEFPILSVRVTTPKSISDVASYARPNFGGRTRKLELWKSASQKKSNLTFYVLRWSGNIDDNTLRLQVQKDGIFYHLSCHGGIVLNNTCNQVWTCPDDGSNTVAMFALEGENWKRKHEYCENQLGILQLALSYDETYLIGTFMDGFLLWKAQEGQDLQVITLKLPRSIRNVTVKMNKSNECILSKNNIWAIAGVRKVP